MTQTPQTSSTDKIGCISHRAGTRFFVMYEDFLEVAKVSEHQYKLAAFWRVLETKTNDRMVYNEGLIEKAKKEGLPPPETNLWIELPYRDCVLRALGLFQSSSFQIAAAESDRLGFSRSRTLQRRRRPGDETSPLEDYKEYLLDTKALQKAILTGEYPTPIENNSPLLKSIAMRKAAKKRKRAIENNSTPIEINTGAIENNNNKYITESNNDRDTIRIESTGDAGTASADATPSPDEQTENVSQPQGDEDGYHRTGAHRATDQSDDSGDHRSAPTASAQENHPGDTRQSRGVPQRGEPDSGHYPGDQGPLEKLQASQNGAPARPAGNAQRAVGRDPGLYESQKAEGEPSEQPSYSPEETPAPRKRGKKTPPPSAGDTPATPIVYAYPEPDVPWSTTKCLAYFRAWRGAELIGKYNLAKAAECAKALANGYSEDVVIRVHEAMNRDPYWIERGGADIGNVANNIAKEARKLNKTKAPPAKVVQTPPPPPLTEEEQEEQRKKCAEALANLKRVQEEQRRRKEEAALATVRTQTGVPKGVDIYARFR